MINVKELISDLKKEYPVNEAHLNKLDQFYKDNGIERIWPRLEVEFIGKV